MKHNALRLERRHSEVGHGFRGSIPGLRVPLSTLRRWDGLHRRMTRGRCGSLRLQRVELASIAPRREPSRKARWPRGGDRPTRRLRSRFPTGCFWRRVGVITVVYCMTVLAPQQAFAQDLRLTVSFLRMGGGKPQAPGFSFEMVDTVSLGALTLPTFRFISTDSGTRVTNSTMALPVLSLAGLSLTPQYGEQKLSLLASPLSGLKLKSQKVRGFSVSTTHGSNAFTLMLGQLSGKKTGFVGVPSVLAFTGTLQPSSRLAFAPRVVTHLGSQSRPGSADTSVGAGVSAVLSSHVKLIGDIAEARTRRGRWAPSVVVGSVGKWSRWSVEASLRRTDQDDAGRMTQALTVKIDRVGTLELTRTQVTRRSRLTDKLSVEWRQKRFGKSVVRLTEEREQDALSDREGRLVRQLQVEFKGRPGQRVSLSGRTSVLLSELAPSRSRVRSRLKGRVTVGGRLELTGEAEYDLFGNRAAAVSIGEVGVGGDVALSDRTILHLVYSRDPHAPASRSQRFEARISQLVSFHTLINGFLESFR